MTNEDKITRREFVASTAAAATAFTIIPAHVLAGNGNTVPSEKLNIAAIGAGGIGFRNLQAVADQNIVALCDVDQDRAASAFELFPSAKRYKDFRQMLEKEDKNIDAVIIAAPDHVHAVATMMAMKMGKHVYTQKPLTYSVDETRQLTAAAKKYKVVTQMGNQGHSGEGIRLICEWIWDGAIGPVRQVHCWTNRPVWPQGLLQRPTDITPVPDTLDWDLWLGPAPTRPYNPVYLPFKWRGWLDFGCGALGDMGCHIMDAAYTALKLGTPESIQASCSATVDEKWKRAKNTETYPQASIVHYKFPARGSMPPVELHWYDGGILPQIPDDFEPGRKIPDNGTIFVGEKGNIMCDTYADSPRIVPEEKMLAYKRPAETIKRIEGSHEQNWVTACKDGEEACSNFDFAGPFTETILLGNMAAQLPGQKLLWDGENMKFKNNVQATAMVKREYREGWSL